MVILGNAIAKPSYRKDATIIKNGNEQDDVSVRILVCANKADRYPCYL